LPNRAVLFGLSPQVLLATAEQADTSDLIDSVWVGDNFLSKPRLEAIVTLSAVAARTRRLKLGTVCMASFPMRHPLLLAIQWASLDVLSGGRTILVVCNGGSSRLGEKFATELATSGIRSAERVPRLEEGIELLRLLFGPEPVTFQGRYYNFEKVDMQPKPLQSRVPIGIAVNPLKDVDAATEERFLRRVARLADVWQTDAVDPAVFRERWLRVQEYAVEYGRPGGVAEAQLHLMVNINDDAARARQESVEFLTKYYGEGTIGDDLLHKWLAFGSPSQVVDRIGTFIEAGYTTPILRFTSHDQLGQLARCVTEVLPAFRERLVAAPAG
jgi:alkanesulfonate monooxygenase SsuD/methylene tetrahydromethanopterin reductase-like flavin-dependent oxidoreductase (luciferase family)